VRRKQHCYTTVLSTSEYLRDPEKCAVHPFQNPSLKCLEALIDFSRV
jgi:hypothetical protein